jgi:hypothetical protein
MPHLLLLGLPYLAWGFFIGFMWLWLRKAITPQWVAQLVESEGVPSIRLTLACIVVLFTLCMEAAGRLEPAVIDANLFFAGTLLGLGVAKVAAGRFAPKPTTDATDKPKPTTPTE